MEKIRVLITGGLGFIGTNLVQYYLDKGDKVLNVDIKPSRNTAYTKYWQHVDILENTLAQVVLNFHQDYNFI